MATAEPKVEVVEMNKRGGITLPPRLRRRLQADSSSTLRFIVELRDGGIFLRPAITVPVRDYPVEQMRAWVAEDESAMRELQNKAKKK